MITTGGSEDSPCDVKLAARSGNTSAYYHFDYAGDTYTYKWLNVTQIPKVFQQMNPAGASVTITVNVKVFNPLAPSRESILGFVESNNYVSIEAPRFTK